MNIVFHVDLLKLVSLAFVLVVLGCIFVAAWWMGRNK